MDLQKIVYLTDAQYSDLIANGSITVGTETIYYSANDLYLTPSSAGGVPNGGTTGQVLTKASNADEDLVWGNQLKIATITASGTATQIALSSGNYYDLGWRYQTTITLNSNNYINISDLQGCKMGNIQIYTKSTLDTWEGSFDLNPNAINRPTTYGAQGNGIVRSTNGDISDIALISYSSIMVASTITIYSKIQNIIGSGTTHYVEFNVIK